MQNLIKINSFHIYRIYLQYLSGYPDRYTVAVLWIRIRMDPELLPGSGSGIIVPDPEPAKHERADK